MSGGTDGIVTVFDTSVAAGAEGEGDDEVDGAVRTVVNQGSSVHRAKIFGEDLWAVSHDEVLGVYRERGEGEKWDAGDVRRVTEAEYVVDVLPRVGGPGWVVAGNKEGQWVDFCGVGRKAGAWGWGERWRLVGGHGEEVCRDVLVDEGVSFSGGRTGLWLIVDRAIPCIRAARMGWSSRGGHRQWAAVMLRLRRPRSRWRKSPRRGKRRRRNDASGGD